MIAMAVPHEMVFDPVEIPPGEGFTVIKQKPSTLFKGQRIVVTESDPGSTRILLFVVGTLIQQPIDSDGEGWLSAMYSENSDYGGYVSMDVCNPQIDIAFWVRNTTKSSVMWSAKISGKTPATDMTNV